MANTKNSIYLADDLQKYLEEQCEQFGVGKSAFVSLVLTWYRQQTVAINEMANMKNYLDRLAEIVEKSGNGSITG